MAPSFVSARRPSDGLAIAPRSFDEGLTVTTAYTIECYFEGYTLGGMIVLMLIVVCNMKRHILLHHLVFIEQLLILPKAFMIFIDTDPTFGWYRASSSIATYTSYLLHNWIAVIKIRPFLSTTQNRVFVGTLAAAHIFWIWHLFDGYVEYVPLTQYTSHWNVGRPIEFVFRDPWWLISTAMLVHVLKSRYDFNVISLCRSSPRFGVLIACMILAIGFSLADAIYSAVSINWTGVINPYLRIGQIFKSLCDVVFLDDFKTVLDSLVASALSKASGRRAGYSYGQDSSAVVSKSREPPASRKGSFAAHGSRSRSRSKSFLRMSSARDVKDQTAHVDVDPVDPVQDSARPGVAAMHHGDSSELMNTPRKFWFSLANFGRRRLFGTRHASDESSELGIIRSTSIKLESNAAAPASVVVAEGDNGTNDEDDLKQKPARMKVTRVPTSQL